MSAKVSAVERFWSKVDRNGPTPVHRPELGPCWVWTAGLISGYGRFAAGHRESVGAHRYSMQQQGPIPDGMFVLHKCDNPPCVNPAHLFLGTASDNMADKTAKGRQARGPGLQANRRHSSGDRHWTKVHPERIKRLEAHPMARLTSAQVGDIRALLVAGELTHRKIAARFGVDRTTVTAINRGKNWR